MKSPMHRCFSRLFTSCKKGEKFSLFHSLTVIPNHHDEAVVLSCIAVLLFYLLFFCNWITWCSLEDLFIFWADTFWSWYSVACLPQPSFLYNLTMQLHSSDFPSSSRFKLSCCNKHLFSLCLMRIFLSLFFCVCVFLHSLQYVLKTRLYACFTFYSSPYSCNVVSLRLSFLFCFV